MKPTNINDSLIPRLKREEQRYDVRDKKLKGFFVRVYPTGSKSYYVEYTRGQKILLGRTDEISAEDARKKAKVILSGGGGLSVEPSSLDEIKQHYRTPLLKEFIDRQYESWVLWNLRSGQLTLDVLNTQFASRWGHLKLTELVPKLIDSWKADRLKAGIQKSTINRQLTVLKSALNKAVEWGILKSNPIRTVHRFAIDTLNRVRYLQPDEEARMLSIISAKRTYIKPLVLLAMHTGMRRGEMLKLTWDAIDWDRKLLTIKGDNTKAGKTRYIPLNKIAYEALLDWRGEREVEGEEHVFLYHGKPIATVKRGFTEVLKAAKITDFRFHDLRHHFASKLVMAGVDLNTVRELLGHATIDMTLRYAHLAPEHKASAVDKLVNPNPSA